MGAKVYFSTFSGDNPLHGGMLGPISAHACNKPEHFRIQVGIFLNVGKWFHFKMLQTSIELPEGRFVL